MRSGESPFRVDPQDARNGDRPDTARGSEPPGGKDVAVDYVRRTIDGTTRCAALYDVHGSFGHRLNHHWDLLEHVDGSVTVKRENGCLSTATSSIGKGRLAPTLPSRRAYGATCAKIWNVVRDRKDCIFLK